jgi:hypothetical protein
MSTIRSLFVAALGAMVIGYLTTPTWGFSLFSKPTGEGRMVKLDQVPTPAKDMILKEAGTAPLKEVREFDHGGGQKVYLAYYTANGKETRLWVSDGGKLLNKSSLINLDQAPAVVKDAAMKEVGTNKIKEVEEITRPDGKRIYELEYMLEGREAQLRYDADGKLLYRSIIRDANIVPKAVKDTVVAQAGPKVKVRTIVEVNRDGGTYYMSWWKTDGRLIRVLVAPDGKLTETDRELAMDQLPTPVRDAFLKEAGKIKIDRVEEVTRGDVRSYLATWRSEGNKVLYEVTVEGKPLPRERATGFHFELHIDGVGIQES